MSPNALLKTQQVAQAMGVSVSTIKRWVDAGSLSAARTVGKHRLIALGEALRFAREQDLPQARLLRLLEQELPDPSLSVGERVEALLKALERGAAEEAKGLIASAHARFRQAARLGDDLIRPAMQRIGQLWEDGTLDTYQEHRASRIVEASLLDLIGRAGTGEGEGLKPVALAMGASPEGDHSTLPGLLCELTLRELGWDAMNLGPNLPLESLANAVRAHRPRLVWLSVNYVNDPERFVGEYEAFFAAASAAGAATCLGGLALSHDLRARLVAASFGERMAHLAEFARRLQPATDRPPAAIDKTSPTLWTPSDEE